MSRMTAAERRSQLIETAREVFLELGYQGARTSDIAQRAGINEALIYRHFASKDDLFEAAVLAPLHNFVDRLGPRAAEFVAAGDDDARRLSVIRGVHEDLSASMSQVAPLLGMALFSQPARGQKLYAEHIAPLLEKIVVESREGVIDWGGDFDIETVMIGIFGAHFWLALHAALGGAASDAKVRGRQMADFAFSAISAHHNSETRGTVMTNGNHAMGGAER